MRRRQWTILDGISDRLRNSPNPLERRSIYIGRSLTYGYPSLLDTDLLFDHMHIVGPTGIGKTTLGLETSTRQLIGLNDGPVVIFDNKGDPGLFHSVREAALRAGRTFKWFTNKPYRSTYVFNPWDQKLLQRLTLPDILGFIVQYLNLYHGEDYGRAWFSVNARILLRRAILETIPNPEKHNILTPGQEERLFPKYGPIQSFRDLFPILRDLAHDSNEFKAAQHLAFIIESLTDFEQINLAPNRHPNHSALDHAIHMPEVIRENQVVYFYLVGAIDVAAVAEIAKMALYSLLMAATAYYDEHGRPPRVYTIYDEAQTMISKNIEMVLAQARSNGLACILSHQTMSQLNPSGAADLRELVLGCTAVKRVFGARDPWLFRYISETSGTTRYYNQSYRVPANFAALGAVGPEYAMPDRHGNRTVGIEEYTAPRLTYQDILDYSHDPNVSLFWTARPSGLSQFRGWFPVETAWPVSLATHRRHLATPWPAQSRETISTSSPWPIEEEETITAKSHPPVAKTEEEIHADDKLAAIWKKLHEK